jgi:hypothetical protein
MLTGRTGSTSMADQARTNGSAERPGAMVLITPDLRIATTAFGLFSRGVICAVIGASAGEMHPLTPQGMELS